MAIKIYVCTNILTADLRMSVTVIILLGSQWGRGEGGLLISSDGDDWMGGKNQNPKTSQGVPTKPKKIVDQKLKKTLKRSPVSLSFWDGMFCMELFNYYKLLW